MKRLLERNKNRLTKASFQAIRDLQARQRNQTLRRGGALEENSGSHVTSRDLAGVKEGLIGCCARFRPVKILSAAGRMINAISDRLLIAHCSRGRILGPFRA